MFFKNLSLAFRHCMELYRVVSHCIKLRRIISRLTSTVLNAAHLLNVELPHYVLLIVLFFQHAHRDVLEGHHLGSNALQVLAGKVHGAFGLWIDRVG